MGAAITRSVAHTPLKISAIWRIGAARSPYCLPRWIRILYSPASRSVLTTAETDIARPHNA
jgi:hypothetical protein